MACIKRIVPVFLPVLISLVLFFFGDESGAGAVERGKLLFRQKCASCHTVHGGDAKGVGPDLKGITRKRDRKWLLDFIVYTDRMLASDPLARQLLKEYGNVPMPTMGLTEAEGAAVLEYLEYLDSGQGGKEALPAPTGGREVSPGDAERGRDLYLGVLPFQKGGPPCFPCHAAAGDAFLGGGTLGPDLTDSYTRYGEEGLSGVLASLAFPTMEPLYANRPLSPEERNDLKAFFRQTASLKPVNATGEVSAAAAGTFLLLVLLSYLIWRRRFRSVQEPPVKSR
ncbi:MAG: cytochrome c [Alphaproteobacteria bacterium]|uniref:Cytochrome c n=1 Tax=Candidatus Nitrobium versatile TaxID=2884831 RepID=A0A953J6U4_9BACT|nr:cytochrome c [Candidatus Nitrobium versatile]